LAQDGGKFQLLKKLKLKINVLAIGFCYLCYQISERGMADLFVSFTENIAQGRVLA